MPKTISHDVMNERSQHLLKLLITRYIRDGQPVGSRTLSRDAELDLSSATIRNIMADLEDMGLVRSPHMSAGRVPTAQGYRVFIDSLLQINPLNGAEEALLRKQLTQLYGGQRLMEQTSTLLSEITHLVGVVMLPRRDSNMLRHVEFLSLSNKRILVILVVNEQEVQNRIIYPSRGYSERELQQIANYLNTEFAGKDIKTVRKHLLQELKAVRKHIDETMKAAIEVADQAFATEEMVDDFVLSGQTNLMDVAELSNVEKLRDLFAAFNQKQDILHLFDQAIKAQGMQIFIGEESGYEVLGDCSVITSPYVLKGEILGVLGVIGPTRMAYERIIPIVDLTAKLLGSALTQG